MATNFLRFFKTGSARLALVVGALGYECAAGVVYTRSEEDAVGSGLSLGWEMALESKLIGIG